MPIIYWPTLVKQTQAFRTGLDQLAQLKKIPTDLTIQPPLPVYNAGVRDVIMNSNLDASAKLVAWRYFAVSDSQGIAVSGDLDLGALPRVTSLAYGKSVLETLRTTEGPASTDPDLLNAQFEPRLLRIPGLLLECLWLSPMQPLGGAIGWVVPYHTLIRDLGPREPADTFYQKLRPWAEKALGKGSLQDA
jgi:hypothetical protein